MGKPIGLFSLQDCFILLDLTTGYKEIEIFSLSMELASLIVRLKVLLLLEEREEGYKVGDKSAKKHSHSLQHGFLLHRCVKS